MIETIYYTILALAVVLWLMAWVSEKRYRKSEQRAVYLSNELLQAQAAIYDYRRRLGFEDERIKGHVADVWNLVKKEG